MRFSILSLLCAGILLGGCSTPVQRELLMTGKQCAVNDDRDEKCRVTVVVSERQGKLTCEVLKQDEVILLQSDWYAPLRRRVVTFQPKPAGPVSGDIAITGIMFLADGKKDRPVRPDPQYFEIARRGNGALVLRSRGRDSIAYSYMLTLTVGKDTCETDPIIYNG